MSGRDARRALERVEIPGEHEARERAWSLVEAAWSGREPVPRSRRPRLRWALAAAAVAALGAAVASPPGRALVDSLREAVALERDTEALVSLPAPGRLLAEAGGTTWVVHADGARRRLGPFTDATWSPRGRFVAAVRGARLVAMTPDGSLRWQLARRPRPALPAWSPPGRVAGDTRIAYLSGAALRVVGGDGRGDRLLARDVARVRPAWRPGRALVLAYARGRSVVVRAADSGRALWTRRLPASPRALAWSDDGRLLAVRSPASVAVLDARGRLVRHEATSEGTVAAAVAWRPGTHELAEARWHGAASDVFRWRDGRILFTGAGRVTGIEWSPDGRWLLAAWRTADQWLFVRGDGGRRFRSVSSISAQLDSPRFPARIEWCCAGDGS